MGNEEKKPSLFSLIKSAIKLIPTVLNAFEQNKANGNKNQAEITIETLIKQITQSNIPEDQKKEIIQSLNNMKDYIQTNPQIPNKSLKDFLQKEFSILKSPEGSQEIDLKDQIMQTPEIKQYNTEHVKNNSIKLKEKPETSRSDHKSANEILVKLADPNKAAIKDKVANIQKKLKNYTKVFKTNSVGAVKSIQEKLSPKISSLKNKLKDGLEKGVHTIKGVVAKVSKHLQKGGQEFFKQAGKLVAKTAQKAQKTQKAITSISRRP
jgi:hypothetical protein